ncbi:MAG: ATP-binding protein [candidate division Zixibacteria bacterium]|nr:ATP-binding protein [candidate division Zixibacteria bacterium]
MTKNNTTVEQNHAEQALARMVRQYSAMIDTVPAMMFLKDINHKYVTVNKAFCRLANKSADEIIGKTDYDIFLFEKADEYHKTDQIVMNEDRCVFEHEQSLEDADGKTRWISTTRVPLHDINGMVSGVVGLVQDITEQHKSHEQLMQSDKLAAIGTLAAGVAHEINNPVGFISSNLNTMSKYLERIRSYVENTGVEDDDDKEGILDIMTDFSDAVNESIEGTVRVKDIVTDLKSFSRVDGAKKGLVNINEGIESTLNIVWNELKYHCKVEKELSNIPDLMCIPNQLNQVFMNMLLNAGHATAETAGFIRIRTWADDINIYVSIKDNGVGIPQINLKNIFEPFYTTKDVGKGTGLGLSLAYDIIKKHNGNIDVKSEVGVGTEFVVSLPLKGLQDD